MIDIMPDEQEMNERIPLKSVLGREWAALIRTRDEYKTSFESTTDKMDCDVSGYRRSSMAIDRFIIFWLPRVRRAQENLTPRAMFVLESHQNKALAHEKTKLSRHTLMRIWQRHAILRYREILKDDGARINRYHPGLLQIVRLGWRTFQKEINQWKRLSVPFDGSQACGSMISFLASCHQAVVCDD